MKSNLILIELIIPLVNDPIFLQSAPDVLEQLVCICTYAYIAGKKGTMKTLQNDLSN